jgi:uncharacterized membrane protein YozB (DUF420 family)
MTWLGLSGSAVLMVAGLIPGVPKVFNGHVAGLLPTLSVLTFALLFWGLPAALVVCNAAAYQGGGRRLLRCVAITATLLGGLLLSWWLARSAPRARPVFHGTGRVTLSYFAVRIHGLLSWAASLGMFWLSAWILLRPTQPKSTAAMPR